MILLPDSENRMIVASLVSTKHRNVTEDRQTDRKTDGQHRGIYSAGRRAVIKRNKAGTVWPGWRHAVWTSEGRHIRPGSTETWIWCGFRNSGTVNYRWNKHTHVCFITRKTHKHSVINNIDVTLSRWLFLGNRRFILSGPWELNNFPFLSSTTALDLQSRRHGLDTRSAA